MMGVFHGVEDKKNKKVISGSSWNYLFEVDQIMVLPITEFNSTLIGLRNKGAKHSTKTIVMVFTFNMCRPWTPLTRDDLLEWKSDSRLLEELCWLDLALTWLWLDLALALTWLEDMSDLTWCGQISN